MRGVGERGERAGRARLVQREGTRPGDGHPADRAALGVGIAAATLPPLAHRFGFDAAVALPAVLCLVAAALVWFVVVDPPRPARTAAAAASPYRARAGTLVRLHTASAMLVVPQFMAATFAVTYLVSARGWSPVAAGQLVAVVQVVGAAGRIARRRVVRPSRQPNAARCG